MEAAIAPTFSVVIPLFDKREFVGRTLESVLGQRRPATEILVVDDGSTDGGGEIAARFPGVTVIRQENAGVSSARNAGIARARGDWVAFLDADDVWMPWHLEELARIALQAPEAALIATRIEERYLGGRMRLDDRPGPVRRVDYFRAPSQVVTSSSAALRRDVAEAVGGFGPWAIGEDLELWARVALAWPVAISDRPSAIYVRGVGGAMERLAARGLGPAPRHVEELEPACATVTRALREGGHAVPTRSLVAYLDARVRTHIKSAVAMGDPARARALGRLLTRRGQVRAAPFLALALLPRRRRA